MLTLPCDHTTSSASVEHNGLFLLDWCKFGGVAGFVLEEGEKTQYKTKTRPQTIICPAEGRLFRTLNSLGVMV